MPVLKPNMTHLGKSASSDSIAYRFGDKDLKELSDLAWKDDTGHGAKTH